MTRAIPRRGPFPFGPPYHTIGVRVTNEDDGEILPRTYPYWPNINAHNRLYPMRVFLGTSRGPCWWEIDTASLTVTPMGPIFPTGHPLATSTAEGWYWDWYDPDLLYCADDTHLYRYRFGTGALETVVSIPPFSGVALRQWHTGSGGVHSATVKQIVSEGAWPNIGTAVYTEGHEGCGGGSWAYYPKRDDPTSGPLDESQVDRDGDEGFVLIKENLDGQDQEDNRIIRLADGAERIIMDRAGAAGHSDNGFGYMVHADNWQTNATWRVTMFDADLLPQGRVVLTTPWDAQVIHVSHCNARRESPEVQWVLGSGTIPELWMIPLDSSGHIRAVAPSMCTYPTPDPYDYFPKANIDPPGQFACWTRFADGRFDAFMVQLDPGTAPVCTHGCPVHCPVHARA